MNLERSTVRRVLCALDAARSGSTSLAMASLLAERFHASIDALYAMPPAPTFDGRVARVKRLLVEHDSQERMQNVLASAERQVCVSSFVTRGSASAVILAHSQRYASDLIVMASSRRQRFAAAPSTVAPVSALARCAVLTVGDDFRKTPIRRILLPIGATGVECSALGWAITLAAQFGAEVELLRIGAPNERFWKTPTPSLADSSVGSRIGLSDALVALGRMKIAASELTTPGGNDGDAVSRLCASEAFDAVVLGLPASGQGRDISDAFAGEVRRRTNVSVLSVRSLRSPALFAPRHFAPLLDADHQLAWSAPAA